MTIDYYLSMGSLITGIVTNSPVLEAVPTAFRLTATFLPRLFPLGISKIYTSEEQAKLDNIKASVKDICKNLGIKDSTKINLRVSHQLGENACMVGTTSSIGGPLLCLGNTYFTKYEPLPNSEEGDFREWLKLLDEIPTTPEELTKYNESCPAEKQTRIKVLSEKFKSLSIIKDPEFREWLRLLEGIPNTPSELGKYLDSCTEQKRTHIKELAKKFKDVLSQEELESILAHELGHAKHHHLLKSTGLLMIYFLAEKVGQSFADVLGLGEIFSLASLPLFYLTIKAISREHEVEADGECAAKDKYQKGMLKFHKKNFLTELFEATSSAFESKTKEMIQDIELTSTHPNHARRFAHASELLEQHKETNTAMTNAAWVLVGLGVVRLAVISFSDYLKIRG